MTLLKFINCTKQIDFLAKHLKINPYLTVLGYLYEKRKYISNNIGKSAANIVVKHSLCSFKQKKKHVKMCFAAKVRKYTCK